VDAPTQPQPPQWGQPGYQPPAGPSPLAPPTKRSRKRWLLILAGIPVAFIVLGLIAAILVPAEQATAPTATEAKESGISKGAGTKDAAADVKLLSFQKHNTDGFDSGEYRGTIEIVNHSEGTSDYYIELVILDSRGTNIDWSNAVAEHVRPGQRALVHFSTFESSTAKAQITQIQRTASS
jgi:hypothetical protein